MPVPGGAAARCRTMPWNHCIMLWHHLRHGYVPAAGRHTHHRAESTERPHRVPAIHGPEPSSTRPAAGADAPRGATLAGHAPRLRLSHCAAPRLCRRTVRGRRPVVTAPTPRSRSTG